MDHPYRPYQNEVDQFQTFPFYNCRIKQLNIQRDAACIYNLSRRIL